MHPEIRSAEACYKSSSFAMNLAKKHNTRLHILHITTGKEANMFENKISAKEKRITSEICVHHLWFSDKDYDKFPLVISLGPSKKHKDL